MTKSHNKKNIFHRTADFLTAVSKVALESKKCKIPAYGNGGETLVIMGNGPSLRQTISESMDKLKQSHSMAVNFAANAPEFFELKPRYYILADPHFMDWDSDANVAKLWSNLEKADWDMTLFVPFGFRLPEGFGKSVKRFNAVGIDASESVEKRFFDAKRAMPRPRNVLIPAIMLGVWMNYKKIVIVGADHTWMQTISVNENNEVVSVQPHFYKEAAGEQKRVNSEYAGYRLHNIIHSFYVAFNAYHQINRYAALKGITIINATPGSFIDAFTRGELLKSY